MARPSATPEEREQRSNQLLDAAVALWLEHPERIASVAEVAERAGVAKGTVYLYFRCKEDLLLAAHLRNAEVFFAALDARTSASGEMAFNDIMELTRSYIVDSPVWLPLATLVAGLMHKGVSQEAHAAFEIRMAELLRQGGMALRRKFPVADEIGGVRLLMRSYALILGLWQLVGNVRPMCINPEVAAMLKPDYSTELNAALQALWKGALHVES